MVHYAENVEKFRKRLKTKNYRKALLEIKQASLVPVQSSVLYPCKEEFDIEDSKFNHCTSKLRERTVFEGDYSADMNDKLVSDQCVSVKQEIVSDGEMPDTTHSALGSDSIDIKAEMIDIKDELPTTGHFLSINKVSFSDDENSDYLQNASDPISTDIKREIVDIKNEIQEKQNCEAPTTEHPSLMTEEEAQRILEETAYLSDSDCPSFMASDSSDSESEAEDAGDPLQLGKSGDMKLQEPSSCAAGPRTAGRSKASGSTRHSRSKKSYKCDTCLKTFSTKDYLVVHFRTHSGEKPFVCQVCGKGFIRKQQMVIHLSRHTVKRPYLCKVCQKGFTSASNLKAHTRVHTPREKPFQCEMCSKRFYERGKLSVHMRVHTEEKRFKCATCDKGFAQGAHLTKHLRTHTGERPFRCKICEKRFAVKYTLHTHMSIHSGEKRYRCAACAKSFRTHSALFVHTRVHTGEKPYCCAECDKRFSRSEHLKKHMHVHTREKPYVCTRCNKRFSTPSGFKYHMRGHDKSFTCDTCGLSFGEKNALRDHVAVHTSQ